MAKLLTIGTHDIMATVERGKLKGDKSLRRTLKYLETEFETTAWSRSRASAKPRKPCCKFFECSSCEVLDVNSRLCVAIRYSTYPLQVPHFTSGVHSGDSLRIPGVQQGLIDDRPSLKFYARFIITKPPFTAPQSLLIELSHQQLMYVIAVIEHH
jgi:hypothetical protein